MRDPAHIIHTCTHMVDFNKTQVLQIMLGLFEMIPVCFNDQSLRIHVWYIRLHLAVFFVVNVGKYTSPMDPMGMVHSCQLKNRAVRISHFLPKCLVCQRLCVSGPLHVLASLPFIIPFFVNTVTFVLRELPFRT